MAGRARRRDPATVPARAQVCAVDGCVPGLHGPIVDGLCPIHTQTHPGLARPDTTEGTDRRD